MVASKVRVARETQGKGGHGVTVVIGLTLAPNLREQLAKDLKKRCGAGGKLRPDGVIEIHGEHRDSVVAELAKKGIAAKRSGG